MLICNNCGHLNAGHVSQCSNCNIAGHFTPQQEQGGEQGQPSETENTSCINCGTAISDDDAKCGRCHFPQKHKWETKEVPHKISLKLLRRTA